MNNPHDLLIEALTMKPEQFFEYQKNKEALQEFSKDELIDICLISLDVITKLNSKLDKTP